MTSPIPDGSSEIDSVSLRILSNNNTNAPLKEIKNWKKYTLTSSFLDPVDKWSFVISGEDRQLYQNLLPPGSKVQIACNGFIQCTGFIDQSEVKYDRDSGTEITFPGRDILSRAVNANADMTFQFKKDMTVADVVYAAVLPYDIGTLYNSYGTHLNIVTGRPNSESLTTKKVTTYKADFQTDASGNYVRDPATKVIKTMLTPTVSTEIVANLLPSLTDLPIQQYKPHPGEGGYEYVSRLIKREGLILKAVADGSGCMVISPDFTSPAVGKIVCKDTPGGANNVLSSSGKRQWYLQPTVIIGAGYGGGSQFAKSKIHVIMINELTGLDSSGDPLPSVKAIIAQYPKALVSKIRPELVPASPMFAPSVSCPMTFVDDEAKTPAQLEAFCRRKLAEKQQKALMVDYTLTGHTQNGIPWAVNTVVNVDDDIHNIHQPMWVLERTFSKARNGKTQTDLTLIALNTLLIG